MNGASLSGAGASGAAPRLARRPPTLALVLRSLIFTLWVWGLGAVMGLICLPLLLGPRRQAQSAVRLWSRLVLAGLKGVIGANVEVQGLEHLPKGGCLIAAKHQGMLDIIPPFDYLDDPCLVMKKELMAVPVFGWFSSKVRMIVVDREAGSKALRSMVKDAKTALEEGRQIIIFPEGTRKAPGDAPDYKPGIAALYRELELPCIPLATNSGTVWPAKGLLRYPGTVVFQFLEPIPAGMKRAAFMSALETAVETASNRLLT